MTNKLKSSRERTKLVINEVCDRHEERHGDLLALCFDPQCVLVSEIARLTDKCKALQRELDFLCGD